MLKVVPDLAATAEASRSQVLRSGRSNSRYAVAGKVTGGAEHGAGLSARASGSSAEIHPGVETFEIAGTSWYCSQ
jgi:hypothetical protein